jgi:cob(I)alamin adenosyltransferase
MMEFDRVTTRGGDRGESSLFNGERRVKDDAVFEALGDLDELISWIGLVKAEIRADESVSFPDMEDQFTDIQRTLMRLSAEIATPVRDPLYKKLTHLTKDDVEILEAMEGAYLSKTEIGSAFIVPGASSHSARLDIARTICRRAERRLVTCIRSGFLGHLSTGQNYLNRLSDVLFILARHTEQS